MRLQKFLSETGVASRRKAEEMIIEGRVAVNGKPAQLGMKVDPAKDFIKVDGKPVTRSGPKLYFAFHKPRAVMSTLEDPQGRPTVKDFLHGIKQRVYPVGRLDYHSEGLLLITNDGEFANMVLHPTRKIPKTYEVKVKGIVEEENLEKLRGGIKLEDGITQPAKVSQIGKTEAGNSWVEITIHEGRKRQVRRMFDRVGHPVLKLKRTSVGGVKLGALAPGALRPLSPLEVERIVKGAKGTSGPEIKNRAVKKGKEKEKEKKSGIVEKVKKAKKVKEVEKTKTPKTRAINKTKTKEFKKSNTGQIKKKNISQNRKAGTRNPKREGFHS